MVRARIRRLIIRAREADFAVAVAVAFELLKRRAARRRMGKGGEDAWIGVGDTIGVGVWEREGFVELGVRVRWVGVVGVRGLWVGGICWERVLVFV
jgi:hypothetical protein